MDVLMPQPGETVAEGKVTAWFKPVGGVVPVGAVVATISDKAGAPAARSAPIPPPAPAAAPKAPAPAVKSAAASPAPVPPPAPNLATKMDPYFEVRTPAHNYGAAQTSSGTRTTPLARRLAKDAGIDISKVKGSGPKGRVTAADIKTAPPARGAMASGPGAAEIMALYKDTPYTEVPLDGMRRTIAARLLQAKQTIPHFYVVADITIDALAKLRAELNAAAPTSKDTGPAYKFSLNDFIIKAWAAAFS